MALFLSRMVTWISTLWDTINVSIGTFAGSSIRLGNLILALLITAIVITATIRSVRV